MANRARFKLSLRRLTPNHFDVELRADPNPSFSLLSSVGQHAGDQQDPPENRRRWNFRFRLMYPNGDDPCDDDDEVDQDDDDEDGETYELHRLLNRENNDLIIWPDLEVLLEDEPGRKLPAE